MALALVLNGQPRVLDEVAEGASLTAVIEALALQADRIAVELNGEIARRGAWAELVLRSGDKLEIVHFVGGGCIEPG